MSIISIFIILSRLKWSIKKKSNTVIKIYFKMNRETLIFFNAIFLIERTFLWKFEIFCINFAATQFTHEKLRNLQKATSQDPNLPLNHTSNEISWRSFVVIHMRSHSLLQKKKFYEDLWSKIFSSKNLQNTLNRSIFNFFKRS